MGVFVMDPVYIVLRKLPGQYGLKRTLDYPVIDMDNRAEVLHTPLTCCLVGQPHCHFPWVPVRVTGTPVLGLGDSEADPRMESIQYSAVDLACWSGRHVP